MAVVLGTQERFPHEHPMSGKRDEPAVHIERRPLPWRGPMRTECGRVLPVEGAISAEQALADITKHGSKRMAFVLCMTCLDRGQYHGPFRQRGPETPSAIIAREVDPWRGRGTDEMDRDLRAIGALVDRHREEYEALLQESVAAAVWEARKQKRRETIK